MSNDEHNYVAHINSKQFAGEIDGYIHPCTCMHTEKNYTE